MKVCIFGAGVIGGTLASAIQRGGGHEVSLIARGAHLAAIRSNGLVLRHAGGSITTRHQASADPREIGPQDLVIVAAKTPALPDIARAIGPLIGRDTLVAFAQNGIFWFYGDGFAPAGMTLAMRRLDPDGRLHEAIGAERALGMVCMSGGEIIEPGIIELSRTDGRFVCGPALAGSAPRARELIGALRPVGPSLSWTDDIRREMWIKNVNVVAHFGTCALTGATIAEVHADDAAFAVQQALMAETNALAAAHGFDLGIDLDKARATRSTSPHRPSMLQDLERGRSMEIDSSYLVLQDLARQARVPTPTIDVVAALLALRARTAGCHR